MTAISAGLAAISTGLIAVMVLVAVAVALAIGALALRRRVRRWRSDWPARAPGDSVTRTGARLSGEPPNWRADPTGWTRYIAALHALHVDTFDAARYWLGRDDVYLSLSGKLVVRQGDLDEAAPFDPDDSVQEQIRALDDRLTSRLASGEAGRRPDPVFGPVTTVPAAPPPIDTDPDDPMIGAGERSGEELIARAATGGAVEPGEAQKLARWIGAFRDQLGAAASEAAIADAKLRATEANLRDFRDRLDQERGRVHWLERKAAETRETLEHARHLEFAATEWVIAREGPSDPQRVEICAAELQHIINNPRLPADEIAARSDLRELRERVKRMEAAITSWQTACEQPVDPELLAEAEADLHRAVGTDPTQAF